MSGYAFHPDAFADLDEIWEYIAQDNYDFTSRATSTTLPMHQTRSRFGSWQCFTVAGIRG